MREDHKKKEMTIQALKQAEFGGFERWRYVGDA
jgi:hypothetical protein